MQINITYDASVTSGNFIGGAAEEAEFKAAVQYVVDFYDTTFTTNVTLNIEVGYGTVLGQTLSAGATSESFPGTVTAVPYSTLLSQIHSLANDGVLSTIEQSAYDTPPTSISGFTVFLTNAEEKAFGLIAPNAATFDGAIVFGNPSQLGGASWDYSTSTTAPVPANEYYFVGSVEHEISELMGRVSYLAEPLSGGLQPISFMDFFRYYGAGERDVTATPPSVPYFSINGGNTVLGYWNDPAVEPGDLGDWIIPPVKYDAFDVQATLGEVNPISEVDLELMNVLGWDMQPNTVTSGETDYVSSDQISSGITVLSGGTLDVLSGGAAIGTMVNGGELLVNGTASGTIVSAFGIAGVFSGGTASGTMVDDGGIEDVESGATNISATISSGGREFVYMDGADRGTTVSNGGVESVSSGGAVLGGTVGSGGILNVSSGGTASDTIVGNGGMVDVFDGGSLTGNVANSGTVTFDITDSNTFSGSLAEPGNLVVSGGGDLNVTLPYSGSAQIDDTSTLEFSSTYVGVATFSGSSTGPGGTLKLDAPSTGPIAVVNSNDTVIAQPGGNNWINATVNYTLPANIDALFLYAGAHGTGNSDAASDALYALDAGNTQTLTGNSANDTFVVYNSSDVVVPKASNHDVVFAAASYTLPTGVDTLILEGTATQGVGNSDAAGDGLYAANAGQVATLTGNSASDTFVVYNSADVVVPKAGSHDVVYTAASYTLPTGVDVLILEAGATQGVGNSDAAGDALYAANPGQVATLTGNSASDTFVVYNSADVVVPKASSHDIVYSAVNYTLPTGADSLILEAGTLAVGNSDASGDTLYAANAGIAQTLTGNSHNDTFVVYNSADTVIGQASSIDTVYAAVNFTLPTNVDTLFLEGPGATHGTGNGDAVNALYGNGGVASTLVAGSGADILYVTGTAGTILTGGAGHDTFAFPNVMGKDEVTNFGIAKDTLQFNATLFSNFTAAMNAASQVGANTVFTIDTNDTVTLDNVTKSSLTASNFHIN